MVKLTDLMQMIVLPCERLASTKTSIVTGGKRKTIRQFTLTVHCSTVGYHRKKFAKPMKMKWPKYRRIVGLWIASIHTYASVVRFLLKVTEHNDDGTHNSIVWHICIQSAHKSITKKNFQMVWAIEVHRGEDEYHFHRHLSLARAKTLTLSVRFCFTMNAVLEIWLDTAGEWSVASDEKKLTHDKSWRFSENSLLP